MAKSDNPFAPDADQDPFGDPRQNLDPFGRPLLPGAQRNVPFRVAPPPNPRPRHQPPPGEAKPPVQADKLEPGQQLEAYWGNRWWDAKAKRVTPEGKVEITWPGWDAHWDEVVEVKRLRQRAKKEENPPPAEPIVPQPRHQPPPGEAKPPVQADQLEPGQQLEAYWGNRWWDAKVKQVTPDGKVEITWPGYGPHWDEVVEVNRLRQRVSEKAQDTGDL